MGEFLWGKAEKWGLKLQFLRPDHRHGKQNSTPIQRQNPQKWLILDKNKTDWNKFEFDKTKKRDVSVNISSFCGAERARTVDLLRDRQAF